MNRRFLLAVAMWLAAAVVAVLTGLAAVRVIGEGITSPAGTARDPQDVARALAGAPQPQEWPLTDEPPASGPDPATPAGDGRAATPRATGGPAATRRPDDSTPRPRPTADSTRPAATSGARPGRTTPAPAGPTTRPRPSSAVPRPAATTTTLRTPGGSLVARCTGDQVQLVSWAPAQGYATHAVHRGPDDKAEIRFRGPDGEVRVTVVCGRAGPVAAWRIG